MAGALPAAALPARPSSTPRSYGICISMGRAQPAHLLGLRSVLEGPSLMLLPIDTLVHEIKKKIKMSAQRKAGKIQACLGKILGTQPNGHIEKWGVSTSGGSMGSTSSDPGPQPSCKVSHSLSHRRGKSGSMGKWVISSRLWKCRTCLAKRGLRRRVLPVPRFHLLPAGGGSSEARTEPARSH